MDTTTTQPTEYRISDAMLETLTEKLADMARKAERLGLEAPTVTILRSAVEPVRDHCDVMRQYHYVTVTGQHAQVGRSCLRDFIPGHDVAGIAALYEALSDMAREAERDEDPDYSGDGMVRGRWMIRTLRFMHLVACEIRTAGWVSGKVAREMFGKSSTKHAVEIRLLDELKRPDDFEPVTAEDEALAAEVIAWARELDPENDYQDNLRKVAAADYFPAKLMGIAASMIVAYEKAQGIVRERARKVASQHIGTVGKKIETTVTVDTTQYIENDYGGSTLVMMHNEDGNVLKWFASNCPLERGGQYVIKATVKKHEEYNGCKQTAILRAKIVKTISSPSAEAERRMPEHDRTSYATLFTDAATATGMYDRD